MITSIIDYFAKDPLKILYLLGGSGGIWYWINQWRGRVRIRVRLLNETFSPKENPNLEVNTTYEIENIGSSPTSLIPQVTISGYAPDKDRISTSFEIEGLDRHLPPFQPKQISAAFKVEARYMFLLFRTYTFRPTRGSTKRIRVWSVSQRNLNCFQFHYELMKFKLLGKYDEPQND